MTKNQKGSNPGANSPRANGPNGPGARMLDPEKFGPPESQTPSLPSYPSSYNLSTAVSEGNYTGSETAQIYVPGAACLNLDRARHRESEGIKPLPKGATVCALIDRGITILKSHREVSVLAEIQAHSLRDDGLGNRTAEVIYEQLNDLGFRIPSSSRHRRIQIRCPEWWKMNILELSSDLGTNLSTLGAMCLMRALSERPYTLQGHVTPLAEPMRLFLERIDERIEHAESMIRAMKGGRVFA